MKVAFLAPELDPNHGWGRYAVDVLRHLADCGVVAAIIGGREGAPSELYGVPVRPLLPQGRLKGASHWAAWLAARRVRAAVRGADVVHALSEPAVLYGTLAARERPMVFSGHGTFALTPFTDASYARVRKAMESVAGVVYSSGYTARRVGELWRAPMEEVIPLGVDTGRFPMRPRPAPTAGPARLLSVGGLSERKGFPYLVEAVAILRRRGRAVRLTIVGAAPSAAKSELPRIEGQIASLNLADSVDLPGRIDEERLGRLFAESDLFALAPVNVGSKFEGFGLVYLEAAASGLPCVGTRENGSEDAVLDGRTGLLVPQRDPQALADAIESILGDPARYEAMSREGVAWAERQAWPNVAQRLCGFYERVLAARAERAIRNP